MKKDKIIACILGSALGDALGAYTEFRSRNQLRQRFPNNDDFKFPPDDEVARDLLRVFGHRENKCHWTDDTSQMILLLQMLIENNNKIDTLLFARKLYDWLDNGIPECGETRAYDCGGLTLCVIRSELFREDPTASSKARWEERGCSVAPNGSLMRNAIMALRGMDYTKTIQDAVEIGKTTHYDSRCDASIAIITSILWDILNDTPEHMILPRAKYWCRLADDKYIQECEKYFETRELFDIELLEQMGYVLKCMGVAVWAIREAMEKGREYKDIILDIVLGGGDTDTNACVAGGVLGVYYGTKGIPTEWVNKMPYKDWLLEQLENFLILINLD